MKNFQCFIATLKLNLKQGAPPGHEVTMLLIPLNVEIFLPSWLLSLTQLKLRLDVNEALLRVHWNFYGGSLISKNKNKCIP